jgi:hypothetical protein
MQTTESTGVSDDAALRAARGATLPRPLAHAEDARSGRISRSEPLYWLVLAVFCTAAVAVILRVGERPVEPAHLLLFACGVGALLASLVWLLAIALDHSTPWSIVLVIPYVNALVLPIFIRLYWSQGARAPGVLFLVGLATETTGALLMFRGAHTFVA